MPRSTRSKAIQRKQATPESRPTQAPARPTPGPHETILALQRTAGNRGVSELLQALPSQTERPLANVPLIVHDVLNRDAGQPLDPTTRAAMEAGFGHDLDDVRVHTGAQAADSAQEIGARAYAAGKDVVFGAEQYAPNTEEGRKLLTHELAHTIHQPGSAAQGMPAVMRTPLPGALEPPSLLGSTIPVPAITRIGGTIVATVYFGQNNFLLDTTNYKAVEQLSDELRFMAEPMVAVDGYASGEGNEKYNQELSDLRRMTVLALLRKGASAGTVSGKGHGAADPAVPETGKVGAEQDSQRALNRRVSIVISSTVAASPKATETPKKPPDIFVPPSGAKPETDAERINRMLKEAINGKGPQPLPKTSFSEEFWKGVDRVVDDLSKNLGIPPKYRGLVRDGAHALIEKGTDKALDAALDAAKLGDKEKEAIKNAIEAAGKTKL